MNRRRASVVLLLLFVLGAGVGIVVGGSRSALQQGVAPLIAQFAGYLCALSAAALLLSGPRSGTDDSRRIGATVLGAVLVLVLLDVLFLGDAGGANIGGGLVRLVALVVLLVATVRLARETAAVR